MMTTRSWVICGQTQCSPLAMEARERRQSSSAQARTASVRGIWRVMCGWVMCDVLTCYVLRPIFLLLSLLVPPHTHTYLLLQHPLRQRAQQGVLPVLDGGLDVAELIVELLHPPVVWGLRCVLWCVVIIKRGAW